MSEFMAARSAIMCLQEGNNVDNELLALYKVTLLFK